MTNVQGLYFCVAVAMVVAALWVTMVVRRNKDSDYNRTDSVKHATSFSLLAVLIVPAFIVIGISLILFVLYFHT